MTLKEACEKSDLTIDGLSKIERNINGASMATLERLARTYRCEIGDLLPNSGSVSTAPEFEPVISVILGLSSIERQEIVSAVLPQVRLLTRLLVSERDNTRRADIFLTGPEQTTNIQAHNGSGQDVAGIPGDLLANNETAPTERRNINRRTSADTAPAKRSVSKLSSKK